MKITGYDLPLVHHPGVPNIPIHPHQAAMVDEWNNRDSFLLVTKTGSGKTAASALPVLLNRNKRGDNCAVFVYPTKALIEDQERSIIDLIKRQNLTVNVITPNDNQHRLADIDVVRLDADILDEFCHGWSIKRKADALENLLNVKRARIVLINPDILYLLYSLKYGRRAANPLAALQAYQTIVFDEFHLYNGVELANILYLIHAARSFGAFKRVVLLSATPHNDVRKWIDKLLQQPREITMNEVVAHPAAQQPRRVAYDVELSLFCKGRDVVSVAAKKAQELLSRLQELRAAPQNAGKLSYVPLVIILNSVVQAIELEDQLRTMGFPPETIVPIRGLSHRGVRKLKPEQLVVVGTSAIEVGIDFQCDYLIFEAGDAASFIQRFGRLARHQPGEAFLLGSEREVQALKALGDTIRRADLEEGVAQTYPQADARAWFVGTERGAFAALSQAFNVRETIFQDRDRPPEVAETKEAVYELLERTMEDYGEVMQITPKVKQALRAFWKCKKKQGQAWVDDYLKIATFRTSMPNKTVHDRSEERRRGIELARYDAPISVILRRAANPKPERDVVFVDNLTENHKVGINLGFGNEEEKEGNLLTTADYPNFMVTRDDKLDAGSHVMSRAGRKHVFVFVPKDMVEDQIDWRVETFPCGGRLAKYILAFDGDALLLKEIYERVIRYSNSTNGQD